MKPDLYALILIGLILVSGCISTSPPQNTTGVGTADVVLSPSPRLTQEGTGTGIPTPFVTTAITLLSGACPSGLAECSGVCVDLQSDRYHCGSCDNACAAGQSCTAGICSSSTAPACPEGQADCAGTCSDTRYDPFNCGACGNSCPAGQGCVNGTCTGSPGPSCPSTQLMCSGSCVNYLTDTANCGSCSHTCFAGSACKAGSCRCPSGETACLKPVPLSPVIRTTKQAPSCVNLNSDKENCGTCNHLCGVKETCCGGHCVNLNIDPYNCGSCKLRCPGPLEPASYRYCRVGHCTATPP